MTSRDLYIIVDKNCKKINVSEYEVKVENNFQLKIIMNENRTKVRKIILHYKFNDVEIKQVYTDPCFEKIFEREDALSDCLKDFLDEIDPGTQDVLINKISSGYEISRVSREQKHLDILTSYLCLTYVTVNLFKNNDEFLQSLEPLKVVIPESDELKYFNKNFFNYMNYYFSVIKFINSDMFFWFKDLTEFWNSFGEYFDRREKYPDEIACFNCNKAMLEINLKNEEKIVKLSENAAKKYNETKVDCVREIDEKKNKIIEQLVVQKKESDREYNKHVIEITDRGFEVVQTIKNLETKNTIQYDIARLNTDIEKGFSRINDVRNQVEKEYKSIENRINGRIIEKLDTLDTIILDKFSNNFKKLEEEFFTKVSQSTESKNYIDVINEKFYNKLVNSVNEKIELFRNEKRIVDSLNKIDKLEETFKANSDLNADFYNSLVELVNEKIEQFIPIIGENESNVERVMEKIKDLNYKVETDFKGKFDVNTEINKRYFDLISSKLEKIQPRLEFLERKDDRKEIESIVDSKLRNSLLESKEIFNKFGYEINNKLEKIKPRLESLEEKDEGKKNIITDNTNNLQLNELTVKISELERKIENTNNEERLGRRSRIIDNTTKTQFEELTTKIVELERKIENTSVNETFTNTRGRLGLGRTQLEELKRRIESLERDGVQDIENNPIIREFNKRLVDNINEKLGRIQPRLENVEQMIKKVESNPADSKFVETVDKKFKFINELLEKINKQHNFFN